jgi:predicted nucleotidyltransferase
MRPSKALQIHREQIRSVVTAHRATNVRVFGSVLYGKDTEESDLDLLIDPTPETSLMDIGAIRLELKRLLGINVDILTPNSLPEKFREQVVRESIPV